MIVARRKAWKAWTPAQMTTLAWYDAKGGTYITQTGGLVDQWDDRSGNTRHLAQTGAARPTYAADTVSFDGLAQFLVNNLPFMYANGNLSVSCVAAVNTTGTDRRLVSERSTTSTNPFYGFECHNTDASQMCMFIRTDGNVTIRNHTPLSNTGAFNNTQRIYVWGDTGSRVMGYFNSAGAVHADYTRSGTITPTRFGMGGTVGATPGAFLDCDVNELIITSFMDDQLRQLMEGYLAWRWGLQALLPASHPFASCEPRLPLAP
jgi:hypothetical protein